jgi:hypothetical protein
MVDEEHSLVPASLSGARIWLSGSIPEIEGSTPRQRVAILSFVRRFSRRVFERGGHIVHGSHPSFTPTLVEEARRHKQQGGHRDCLVLAVSRYWSKEPDNFPDEWREGALTYETPEASGEGARDQSLLLLRQWIASRTDAVVVVGGQWWAGVAGRAGIPKEIGIAMERNVPCFLLGGLGGAARSFVSENGHLLSQLRNGLDERANQTLAFNDDVGSLAEDVCSQLERLPLVRGRSSDGVTFRILALDGGGIRGAFTAAVLARWEHETGLRIVDHFDLIAGTSTGGILALGLGLGLSAQRMLNFYKKRGPVIFPITRLRGRISHTIRHVWSPKYSQAVLLRELEGAFYEGKQGPIRLEKSLCRLVVPSYHAASGSPHQFRTPHHVNLTADAKTEMAHVALATAAAPTFFHAARIASMVSESSYFDGGVWANSPAMAALVEAVCFLSVPLERIDVLSIGTTEEPFAADLQTRSGILGWIWKRKILELLMSAQQESSLRLARSLTTEARFMRVNYVAAAGRFAFDGTKQIDALADLGQQRAGEPDTLAQVKSRFLNGIAVTPWQRKANVGTMLESTGS